MLEFSQIITYIFIIGAAQGVLLTFFLFNKKENRTANKLLAVSMLIFAIDLTFGVFYLTGIVYTIPWIMALSNSFPYLYGPAIYLYIVILGDKSGKFKPAYFLHTIPFLLVQIYGLFFYYFEGASYHLDIIDMSTPQPWQIVLIGKLIPLSGITYVVLTLLEAKKFNLKLKESYSNIDKINLNWLMHLVFGTAIIWAVVIISYTLDFIYGDNLHANLIIYVSISIFLYTLGIKSLKQPQVVLLDETGESKEEPGTEQPGSYKKSGLADEFAESYLEELLNIMREEQPYKNSKLNLSDLSKMVGVSNHNLSEVINKKLESSFYDFINKYRVEEVKKLIAEDENQAYSILAHGYEAGFSSKSAFYSSFKKICGITPAQYREELKSKRVA
jgi:AraC-like DNA-binding protein